MQRAASEHNARQASRPSVPKWFAAKLIFVMEVFTFKAVARAWQKQDIHLMFLQSEHSPEFLSRACETEELDGQG